ncbi:MAG: hypothetical protein H6873_01720 [Hyphomicrobiaceae bacterium]|nr:hypothetical protein [Hyphomicrobiaceae bacterium]
MPLARLRKELTETIRQSREMAEAIDTVLTLLLEDPDGSETTRKQMSDRIIVGLQAQDRLEQRCRNIEKIIDLLERSHSFKAVDNETAWAALALDELAKPELSGKGTEHSGEVEFF